MEVWGGCHSRCRRGYEMTSEVNVTVLTFCPAGFGLAGVGREVGSY